MSKLKEALVKVEASKGAFESELAISISSISGVVSLFTDKYNVQMIGSKTFMKVFVIEKESHDNVRHVLLPNETFETSTRWVDVQEALLK